MTAKFKEYLFATCSVLLLFSSISYIAEWAAVPYIYAISGAGIAIYLLTTFYKGENLRLKRLNIQQAIAAIMLPLSSYFMFKEMSEWVICLFISALLLVYVVYVKEYEEKKMHGKNNKPSE
jgi:asparagine N-glycosylation enzyme membrane subunit Stt3